MLKYMNIIINGEIKNIDSEKKIFSDLLELYSLNKNNIVVEINNKILNRNEFNECILNEGDKVNIFSFVGGG